MQYRVAISHGGHPRGALIDADPDDARVGAGVLVAATQDQAESLPEALARHADREVKVATSPTDEAKNSVKSGAKAADGGSSTTEATTATTTSKAATSASSRPVGGSSTES